MKILRSFLAIFITLVAIIGFVPPALAFCGFYVAKADTNLYNQASQVIIARDGERTILTMANDYQGEVQDFALVVPVPVLLTEEQVRVGEPKIIERLDNFSAPRLVEYFDPNPCATDYFTGGGGFAPAAGSPSFGRTRGAPREQALGVTVEAKFTIGEYDILILSAQESDGLETWLLQNDYNIPQGASQLLRPYIRDKMKFFVAKVNLEAFEKSDFQSLRPLSIAYESPRFMLPIRLGTINGQNEQDLIVYLLSPKGQVELTNYRTVKIPADIEIPEFVEDEFSAFYKSMFQTAHEKERKTVAFLEYAWDMGWCDPCAANPLTPDELKQAGVFWLPQNQNNRRGGNNVFITRLHVRYTRNTFPEDLRFQETGDRENFQGRYIIRHPYRGEMECDAAQTYRQQVKERQEKEIQTLARVTSWDVAEIRQKVDASNSRVEQWWREIWEEK
ncbi:MAG: DUF2330 domain-containing protein [Cyanobacteriota bacterium]|nr:DUF2330 domain-containing protein [Cyanobacteriota bacterium]